MTDFGIVQLTRQRVRENILQSMNEVCPYCSGTGLMTKKSNMIHELEGWIKRFKIHRKGRTVILKVHPSLGMKLREGTVSLLLKLQFRYLIRIKLIEDEKQNPQNFQILSAKNREDITQEI